MAEHRRQAWSLSQAQRDLPELLGSVRRHGPQRIVAAEGPSGRDEYVVTAAPVRTAPQPGAADGPLMANERASAVNRSEPSRAAGAVAETERQLDRHHDFGDSGPFDHWTEDDWERV